MSMLLRRKMMRKADNGNKITLQYGYGLIRYPEEVHNTYYSADAGRCATSNIPVFAGETVTITPPTGFQVATGAWLQETNGYGNPALYGGWNADLSYTPTADVFVRYVFKKTTSPTEFTGDELDGLVTVTVGNRTYHA